MGMGFFPGTEAFYNLKGQPKLALKHKKLIGVFQKKQLTHAAFFVLTVFLFLYVCYIGIENIFRYNGFKIECQAVEDQFKREQQLKQFHMAMVRSVNDPEFWEMEAKSKLGMILPGEQVFRVIRAQK